MLASQIDLYFWNRMPDYFATAIACQNLCIITLLLLWSNTGQHGSSPKILFSRWKRIEGKEIKRSFITVKDFILLHEKFLQFDWLRAMVFQLNLKYLLVKITYLLRVIIA